MDLKNTDASNSGLPDPDTGMAPLRGMQLFRAMIMALVLWGLLVPLQGIALGDTGCEECRRTAVVTDASGFGDLNILVTLVEYTTTPCFHLQGKDHMDQIREIARKEGWEHALVPSQWKPPEYYFTALFERAMAGPVVSRWTISLYHESGELLKEWVTESDRPDLGDSTYRLHKNRMFDNPGSLFKSPPSVIERIRDFEKRPTSCSIDIERSRVFPGEEIPVTISDFTDKAGRGSREFNRIIVYANEGEIIGGDGLVADARLKAFQLDDGTVSFTYKAPADCDPSTDTIFVHNSCDILSIAAYPLNRTGLEDRIAEKKLNIDCSDAIATIKTQFSEKYHCHREDEHQTYDSRHRINYDVTVEASFEHHKTGSRGQDGRYSVRYKLVSWEITKSSARMNGKSETVSEDGIKTTTSDAKGEAEKGDNTRTLDISFDAQTRKAMEVNFPVFSANFNGRITTTDDLSKRVDDWQYYFRPIWAPFEEFIKVSSGDGTGSIGGKGTHVFKKQEFFDEQKLSVDWTVELKKKE